MIRVMMILAFVLGGLLVYNAVRRRRSWWPVGAFGIWLVALIVLLGIVPAVWQALIVNPNQLAKEKPYIAFNIAATLRRVEPAVLDRRGGVRRRLHRRPPAPADDPRDDDPGVRAGRRPRLQRRAPAPLLVAGGSVRHLAGRPHRAPRHRAGGLAGAHRQPEPAGQGEALHRLQHRGDARRLRPHGDLQDPVLAQGRPLGGGAQGEQRDGAQHPPLGPAGAAAQLQPAAGAAAVLLVHDGERGPLLRERRVHADDARPEGAARVGPAAAGPDLGQPAHHLRARLRRRGVGGEPGLVRRLPRLPRPGRAAGVVGAVARHHAAGDLLRPPRHELRAGGHEVPDLRLPGVQRRRVLALHRQRRHPHRFVPEPARLHHPLRGHPLLHLVGHHRARAA